jgi:hypothetical protein
MRRLRVVLAAVTSTIVVLALGSCERQEPMPLAASAAVAKVVTEKDYDQKRFSNPTMIDNRWFPLEPGMQLAYEGSAVEDGRSVQRRVVFTVTDLVKVIDGIPTVMIWDRDYSAGELVEAELAFFAQDDDGHVWHLGQYPEEYEDGELVAAPAWIAGLRGAKPGLAMKASPQPGMPSYSQGLGPAVGYTDRARVHKVGQETCVALGCYQDVVVTDEFALDAPEARQLKYYAPGVGNVRVGWLGVDPEREVLSLVGLVRLGPEALAQVRVEALKLERSANLVSKDAYAQTPPAEYLGRA